MPEDNSDLPNLSSEGNQPDASIQQPVTQPIYYPPSPSSDQIQGRISASQGLNPPKNKFNFKSLLVGALVALVIVATIFAVLVFTNVITRSEFSTIDYVDSTGVHYSLEFYTKHTIRKLSSNSNELVSKVSKDGKFPLILSITTGSASDINKNGIKDCSGPLPKIFDVQNSSLNQTISVCSFPSTQNNAIGVYVAGVLHNNRTSIITISQDISGTDLSSQSGARQSLTKFGLDAYQDDIKKIVASIKIY